MNVVLTVMTGPRAGVRMRFTDKPAITIGRSKTTDFHVLDGTMSRVHAVVAHGADGWYVEDQKSRNGVWIGDRQVERELLESGVVFHLGRDTSIRFEVEDELRSSSASFPVLPACSVCGRPIESVADVVRAPDGRPTHLVCRTLDHLIGTELGEFRVSERAPSLGVAFFFRAHQPTLNRMVLLEVYDPPLTSLPGFRAQLLEEVRSASRFVHPNILQIYAFDEARGMSFVAMEHFRGERLAQVLEQRRFVKIRGAVQVATGIAEALQHVGTHGVCPAWVSTEQVLVSEEHDAKVKLFEDPTPGGEREPSAREASYTAPEVLAKTSAGGESALVYSVGAILYHMLAGIPPFEGATAADVLRRAQRESPPALRRINMKVSPALAKLVEDALARDVALRPATLAEFLDRLKQAAAPIR